MARTLAVLATILSFPTIGSAATLQFDGSCNLVQQAAVTGAFNHATQRSAAVHGAFNRNWNSIPQASQATYQTWGHLDFYEFSAPHLGATGLKVAGDH